jgi:hypothetical protein
MPLHKSPTLTPALLAAPRRKVRKSTGPRTECGKAQWEGKGVLRAGKQR